MNVRTPCNGMVRSSPLSDEPTVRTAALSNSRRISSIPVGFCWDVPIDHWRHATISWDDNGRSRSSFKTSPNVISFNIPCARRAATIGLERPNSSSGNTGRFLKNAENVGSGIRVSRAGLIPALETTGKFCPWVTQSKNAVRISQEMTADGVDGWKVKNCRLCPALS